MEGGFSSLPAFDPPHVDQAAMHKVLLETDSRMHDNYRHFHPQYAGQMLKPPHPVARLAYSLAMYINPNNHRHRSPSPPELAMALSETRYNP